MAKGQVFIRDEEAIPDLAAILNVNPLDIEYAFKRAKILGSLCVFETEITPEQQAEIDHPAPKTQLMKAIPKLERP